MRAEVDFGELSSHGVSRAQRAPVRFASVRSRRGSWVRRRPRRRGRPHGPGPVGREGTGLRLRPSPSPSGQALCDGRAAMMTQIEHALSSHQITGDVPGRPSPRSATATTSSLLVERCILHSRTTVGAALSSAKCTSRRQGTPAPAAGWPAAPLTGARGGAGCPNLPQRRPAAVSAAKKSAEYQRFFSRAPARSGPLWQIWTTRVAANPREGRHGPVGGRDRPLGGPPQAGRRPQRAPRRANGARRPRRRPPRTTPGAETCTSHSKVQFQPSFSSAKCTSRRGRGRPQPPWTATTTLRSTTTQTSKPPLPARKAQCELSLPKSTSARTM